MRKRARSVLERYSDGPIAPSSSPIHRRCVVMSSSSCDCDHVPARTTRRAGSVQIPEHLHRRTGAHQHHYYRKSHRNGDDSDNR
jgi:hypothetical protein